jgi:hypothetical protein
MDRKRKLLLAVVVIVSKTLPKILWNTKIHFQYLALESPPLKERAIKPDYFLRTILSLTQHGVPLDSIFVMHGGTSLDNHTVLQNTQMDGDHWEPPSHSLHHTVPRDPQNISIAYQLPQGASKRLIEVYKDTPDHKRWRIQEAHDFMWRKEFHSFFVSQPI